MLGQLATGEGKSIVIAMLAIFMVKHHGMRVHVLENNAGLLARDFKVSSSRDHHRPSLLHLTRPQSPSEFDSLHSPASQHVTAHHST